MTDDHHAFRFRKGVFHRGKPTAQDSEFRLGKFISGRKGQTQIIGPRRHAFCRQRKGHYVRLLRCLFHFAPVCQAVLNDGYSPTFTTAIFVPPDRAP